MKGIYVASITPFTSEDTINETALQAVIERNIQEGADGFFIGGSSAECFLLSEKERISLFEMASSYRAKTDLIAHVGAISTGEAIRYAQAAKAFGFPHIAATPPFYYGFSNGQIARYYEDIAASVAMPVIFYNFPNNTGKPLNLEDPDIQALLKSDTVCGIKHTNLDLFQMERIHSLNPNLIMMNGFDETMVAGLAMGAKGSIGSTFNALLPLYKKIYDAYLSSHGDVALSLQHHANAIMQAYCRVGLIAAIKYTLTLQGIEVGVPRRPFQPLNLEQEHYISDVLTKELEPLNGL